jgi:FkbM family methyltransferase
MLIKIMRFIERYSSLLQGKGWIGITLEKEFFFATSLLPDKSPSLCIDIGGNKGFYTEEILKKFPQCKIVIFEPSISNIELLRLKYGQNKNISIEQKAISNFEGEATLYSNDHGSGLASLSKRRLAHFGIEFENFEQVPVIRFEDYWEDQLGSQSIDFVKLDIEGHELDALNGFRKALKSIRLIQFEFGGCNIDSRTYFQDFWYFFKENNFVLFRMTPLGIHKISSYSELDETFKTTNILAKNTLI